MDFFNNSISLPTGVWSSRTQTLQSLSDDQLYTIREQSRASLHNPSPQSYSKVTINGREYSVTYHPQDDLFAVERINGCQGRFVQWLYNMAGHPRGQITRQLTYQLNSPNSQRNYRVTGAALLPEGVSISANNRPTVSEGKRDLTSPDANKTNSHDEIPPIPPVDYNATLHKGEIVGKGGNAIVYADKDDDTKVLKMFTIPQLHEEVEHEVECFNTYYGKGSADIIYNNNDISGIKMTRIQGEAVIYAKNLPPHAEQAIYDMFDRLERNNILFVDTTETNVLYDRDTNRFNPIDISSYNQKHTDSKDRQDSIIESYIGGKNYLINTVLNKIE
ncbi:T3SS effector protein NleH [Salmonella enterica]